jgi:hypothetical protein
MVKFIRGGKIMNIMKIMRSKRKLVGGLALSLTLGVSIVFAADDSPTLWRYQMGGSETQAFHDLVTFEDSSVIAVGSSEDDPDNNGNYEDIEPIGGVDIVVSSIDSDSTKKWNKVLGGLGADTAKVISKINDTSVYVFGVSNGSYEGLTNKGEQDIIVTKLDTNGTVLWNKQFGSTTTDYLRSAMATSDGGALLIVNTSGSFEGQSQIYDYSIDNSKMSDVIMKLDSDGNIQFVNRLKCKSDTLFFNTVEVSEGYVIVGATYGNFEDLIHKGGVGADALVVKINTSGDIVWKKLLGGGHHDTFIQAIKTSDGNVVARAITRGNFDNSPYTDEEDEDPVVVKFNSTTGDVLYQHQLGSDKLDEFYDMKEFDDGSVVFIGYSYGNYQGITNMGDADAIVTKITSGGAISWSKTFGGTLHNRFLRGTITDDNYLVVIGDTNGSYENLTKIGDNDSTDSIISKVDVDGNLVYKKQYGSDRSDSLLAVAPISNGGVIVGGITSGSYESIPEKGNDDALIVKLNNLGNY